jgi:hypothetical protein
MDIDATPTGDESTVHRLPCSMDYDGHAPVKSYFLMKEKSQKGEKKLTAHLRGRELIGQKMQLPDETIGVHATSKTDENGLHLEVNGSFTEMFVWEHDIAPNMTEIEGCMEWMEVSRNVSYRS